MFGTATASLLERVMALAPRGVVFVDDGGLIVRANARAHALLGYGDQELTGQPFTMLLPERLRPGFLLPFGRALDQDVDPDEVSEGATVVDALRSPARRKDGSEVDVV